MSGMFFLNEEQAKCTEIYNWAVKGFTTEAVVVGRALLWVLVESSLSGGLWGSMCYKNSGKLHLQSGLIRSSYPVAASGLGVVYFSVMAWITFYRKDENLFC